jgi:hypothetical protein
MLRPITKIGLRNEKDVERYFALLKMSGLRPLRLI